VKYCVPAAAPVAAPKKAAIKKVTKIAVVNINVLYESSDDEEQEQVQQAQEEQTQKKEKKVKRVKDPNAKFCWATAESDSSGSDSD
jgi:Skp family chaperone for outer membrane proteins